MHRPEPKLPDAGGIACALVTTVGQTETVQAFTTGPSARQGSVLKVLLHQTGSASRLSGVLVDDQQHEIPVILALQRFEKLAHLVLAAEGAMIGENFRRGPLPYRS